jgi:hypothetical protein
MVSQDKLDVLACKPDVDARQSSYVSSSRGTYCQASLCRESAARHSRSSSRECLRTVQHAALLLLTYVIVVFLQ